MLASLKQQLTASLPANSSVPQHRDHKGEAATGASIPRVLQEQGHWGASGSSSRGEQGEQRCQESPQIMKHKGGSESEVLGQAFHSPGLQLHLCPLGCPLLTGIHYLLCTALSAKE